MMDVELKARWVEALRSGEYKQCFRDLWRHTTHGPSFCALGVLSEVLGLQNVEHNTFIYPSDCLDGEQLGKLIELNDGLAWSFAEIADWIEENL